MDLLVEDFAEKDVDSGRLEEVKRILVCGLVIVVGAMALGWFALHSRSWMLSKDTNE